MLLEDAGKGYCHALIPEPYYPPSALHGVEARAQEILGFRGLREGSTAFRGAKHALTLPPI